jgi:hypothetical protein
MSWRVRGSSPGGGRNFVCRSDWLRGVPSLLYNAYKVFPRLKRPKRGADHHLRMGRSCTFASALYPHRYIMGWPLPFLSYYYFHPTLPQLLFLYQLCSWVVTCGELDAGFQSHAVSWSRKGGYTPTESSRVQSSPVRLTKTRQWVCGLQWQPRQSVHTNRVESHESFRVKSLDATCSIFVRLQW